MDPEVQQVWDDFVYWRTKTEKIQALTHYRSPKFTTERQELVARLVAWCHVRHIPPRLWVYHLHQARRWRWPPQIRPGDLMSQNMLDKYSELSDTGAYEARIMETKGQESQASGRVEDPNKDISMAVEAAKARLVGNPMMCLAKIRALTRGYHPHSAVCQACPLAKNCAQAICDMLGFDVVALRLGVITVEQARAAVRHGKG